MTTTHEPSDDVVSVATEVYLAFLREFDRLERVPVAQRDLSAIRELTNESWAEHVERLLFHAPEYVDESDKPTEATVEGKLLGRNEIELIACLVRFPKLVYIEGGERVGDGSRQRFGFRVTMRLINDSWVVDEERFQQRLCNELGVGK